MAQPEIAATPEMPQRRSQAPRDARDRMIVALDVPSLAEAERLVATLDDAASFYKIGMELVFAGGLTLVAQLRGAGKRIFLDMKLLDIDNTIGRAVANIVKTHVNLTTIHAYPGAMRAAAEARGDADLALLAVTVLTSMNDADLAAAGYDRMASALVDARAADAVSAGMDGVVCSVAEAGRVRAIVGPDRLIVTPGIRPAGADPADQKRVATPGDAIRAGADYCVVGRPVTRAAAPRSAADAIVAEIEAALGKGGR